MTNTDTYFTTICKYAGSSPFVAAPIGVISTFLASIPDFHKSAASTALLVAPTAALGTSILTNIYAANSFFSVPKYIAPSTLPASIFMGLLCKNTEELSGVVFGTGLSTCALKAATNYYDSLFMGHVKKPLGFVSLPGAVMMGVSCFLNKLLVDHDD